MVFAFLFVITKLFWKILSVTLAIVDVLKWFLFSSIFKQLRLWWSRWFLTQWSINWIINQIIIHSANELWFAHRLHNGPPLCTMVGIDVFYREKNTQQDRAYQCKLTQSQWCQVRNSTNSLFTFDIDQTILNGMPSNCPQLNRD